MYGQLKIILDNYKKYNELDISLRTLYLSVSEIIENRDQMESIKVKLEHYKKEIEEYKRKIKEHDRMLGEQGRRIDALEELATFEKFNHQLKVGGGHSVISFNDFKSNYLRKYVINITPESLIFKFAFNEVTAMCKCIKIESE